MPLLLLQGDEGGRAGAAAQHGHLKYELVHRPHDVQRIRDAR